MAPGGDNWQKKYTLMKRLRLIVRIVGVIIYAGAVYGAASKPEIMNLDIRWWISLIVIGLFVFLFTNLFIRLPKFFCPYCGAYIDGKANWVCAYCGKHNSLRGIFVTTHPAAALEQNSHRGKEKLFSE